MKRTIYIGNPAYLHCQDRQMKVLDPESRTIKGSIPIEDIGFLVLDHPQISLTHYLMVEITAARGLILSCDHKHLPLGLMTPLHGHVEHTERIRYQTRVSKALKKNLWKQTVISKISNQATLLKDIEAESRPVSRLIPEVRSGDTTNCEAVAAKHYWGELFDNFRRQRHGDTPNDLLNYGYAILLAVVARALSTAGLHLAFGIQHQNKYNPYCLANDIMEPYRPYVDRLVYEMDQDELDRSAKAELLRLMQIDVRIDGKNRPLQVATEISAGSLQKIYRGEARRMLYPEM